MATRKLPVIVQFSAYIGWAIRYRAKPDCQVALAALICNQISGQTLGFHCGITDARGVHHENQWDSTGKCEALGFRSGFRDVWIAGVRAKYAAAADPGHKTRRTRGYPGGCRGESARGGSGSQSECGCVGSLDESNDEYCQ